MKEYLVKIFSKDLNELKSIREKSAKKITGIKGNTVEGFRATAVFTEKEIKELNKQDSCTVKSFNKRKFDAEKNLRIQPAKKAKPVKPALTQIKIINDVENERNSRQKLVRTGNRYVNPAEDDNKKYYNVDEIEYAIRSCENAFIKRYEVNEPTHESHKCSFVNISENNGNKKNGVFIVGGVHGDEWIPPDALIFFIEQLSSSFTNKTDIKFGDYICDYKNIKKIVENLNVIVFPLVNYDGRKFSQNSKDYTSRKNRRPEKNPKEVGVDINRNFDTLWDFDKYFLPDFNGSMSKDKTANNFIGPYAFSEPETRNVKNIFDSNPAIKYFVDIHSDGNVILYNWSNDMFQHTDKNKNFQNKLYWGMYGNMFGYDYSEYIDPVDTAHRIELAEKMKIGIFQVNTLRYRIAPSIDYGAISGSSTDYFDSISMIDNTKPKVHSFTIECATDHMPLLIERENTIKEVTAALLELCRFAADT